METFEVVIKLPKQDFNCIFDFYNGFKPDETSVLSIAMHSIANGTVLPKGHGRLFDERDIVNGNYEVIGNRIYELEPIIEADTESEDKG